MEALGCAAFALLTLVSSNNAQFPLQSTQLSILQVSQSNLRLESFMDALSPAQCRKCSLLNLAQIVQPDVIKYSEGLMCDLLLWAVPRTSSTKAWDSEELHLCNSFPFAGSWTACPSALTWFANAWLHLKAFFLSYEVTAYVLQMSMSFQCARMEKLAECYSAQVLHVTGAKDPISQRYVNTVYALSVLTVTLRCAAAKGSGQKPWSL